MSSTNTKSKQHPAWMDKLFPIIFCLGGIALLVFGSEQLRGGLASNKWPKAEGIITESHLERTGSERKGFRPRVAYSYAVGSDQYYSEQILFGMSSYRTILKSGRQRSHEWLDKYPVGRQVAVAYNPSEPSQSTLTKGANYTTWIAPSMGIAFLAAGLFMFRSSRK